MMCFEDKQRNALAALLSQLEADGVDTDKIAAAKEVWGSY